MKQNSDSEKADSHDPSLSNLFILVRNVYAWHVTGLHFSTFGWMQLKVLITIFRIHQEEMVNVTQLFCSKVTASKPWKLTFKSAKFLLWAASASCVCHVCSASLSLRWLSICWSNTNLRESLQKGNIMISGQAFFFCTTTRKTTTFYPHPIFL